MRCCEYFPIAINNGENENIYLESDYSEFNAKSMRKDLAKYEEAKRTQINNLEKELSQNDRLVAEIASS